MSVGPVVEARLTVLLFYIDGYSQAEVARFLDLPIGTVNSRLQHARRQLREEMRTMVTDVLHNERPGPEFTTRVVQEALRQALERFRERAFPDALRHLDRAVEMAEHLGNGREEKQLRMQALWDLAIASRQLRPWPEVLLVFERALKISEELGDLKDLADKLVGIIEPYLQTNIPRAQACLHRALDLYRQIGDLNGQICCLTWMGIMDPWGDPVTRLPSYEEALSLAERAGDLEWMTFCKASVDLLRELATRPPGSRLGYSWNGYLIEGDSSKAKMRYIRGSYYPFFPDNAPAALRQGDWLTQLAQGGQFLDASIPVGGHWEGQTPVVSSHPPRIVTRVRSYSESAAVPAGRFDHCLLMEHVTAEIDLPDDDPERWKQRNRDVCGTRKSWWAPGVGLVKLQIDTVDSIHSIIELQEFSVQPGDDGYLPLSTGNHWRYAWANAPPEYETKEIYRVVASEGNWHYVEHYSAIYRPGKGTDSREQGTGQRERSQCPASVIPGEPQPAVVPGEVELRPGVED